jgi:RNA polymerase sigma-70 factor (ECF subfamily)
VFIVVLDRAVADRPRLIARDIALKSGGPAGCRRGSIVEVRSDAQLLANWGEGDAAAGESLFLRYYPAVTRFFANKVAGDPVDLIQETFLRCLRGRDRLADPDRFRSYLFGIAYNVLREHFRERYGEAGQIDPYTHTAAGLAPGPGTMVAASDEQRLLLEGLRRIPIELQVVLELFYWESMTSAAIAEALDEPHGTVRTRIRRARQLLEAALRELASDPDVVRRTVADLDGCAARIRELE